MPGLPDDPRGCLRLCFLRLHLHNLESPLNDLTDLIAYLEQTVRVWRLIADNVDGGYSEAERQYAYGRIDTANNALKRIPR